MSLCVRISASTQKWNPSKDKKAIGFEGTKEGRQANGAGRLHPGRDAEQERKRCWNKTHWF